MYISFPCLCLSWDSKHLHANASGCSQPLGEVRRHREPYMVTAISTCPAETQQHQPLAVLPVIVCLGVHSSSYFITAAALHSRLQLCQLYKAIVSLTCFPIQLYQKQHTFFLIFPLLYSNKVSSVWAYRSAQFEHTGWLSSPPFPLSTSHRLALPLISPKVLRLSPCEKKTVTTCFRMLLPFLVPLWSLIISVFFFFLCECVVLESEVLPLQFSCSYSLARLQSK